MRRSRNQTCLVGAGLALPLQFFGGVERGQGKPSPYETPKMFAKKTRIYAMAIQALLPVRQAEYIRLLLHRQECLCHQDGYPRSTSREEGVGLADAGFRIPDSGVVTSEAGLADSRVRIPDSGVVTSEAGLADSGFRIPDGEFRIPGSTATGVRFTPSTRLYSCGKTLMNLGSMVSQLSRIHLARGLSVSSA